MSEENAKKIRETLAVANVDMVINADQTFVNFFMEEQEVAAPTGTKRVGGKVKADVKKGFTLMVSCELETSRMGPPYAVFDGTKLCSAKHPERTLAFKHKGWRGSAPGRTGFMAFQPKPLFDEDITIEWLDWQLDVIYPGKKVGITLDRAPAHHGGRVMQHIKKRVDEGRLALVDIDGGLTSILQVCDLVANKEIKSLIQKGYLRYRVGYIKAQREKNNDPNERVNVKVPVVKMMEII
ncbi:hypothetical protein ACHAWF_003919 [Thalassiosira exigua]